MVMYMEWSVRTLTTNETLNYQKLKNYREK